MATSSRALLRDRILLQLPPTEQLSTAAAGAPGRLDGWSVRGRPLVAASDKEWQARVSWRGGRLIATGDVLHRVTRSLTRSKLLVFRLTLAATDVGGLKGEMRSSITRAPSCPNYLGCLPAVCIRCVSQQPNAWASHQQERHACPA